MADRVTVKNTGVVQVHNLGAGVVHADASGNLTSSTIVNADVSASAAIAVSKLAAGTDTYVLTTVSGVPTWAAAGGGGAPNARYNGYYLASATNYWSNTNSTSSYTNFTPQGTIPSPSVLYNTGFTTPTIPGSNYPGITFTAPYTGTIEFTVGVWFTNTSSGGGGFLQLIESGASTVIAYAKGSSVSTNGTWVVLSGYLDVTASSSYTTILQSTVPVGTGQIGGVAPTATTSSQLSFQMKYVH